MEVHIVAKAIDGYELEIITGATENEEDMRAELTLLDDQGSVLGYISFYEPKVALGPDFVSRAGRPMMQLHTDMLSSVLAVLHGEKRVFVGESGLATREDSSTS